MVIAGSNLGSGGTVRFGATTAATTAWSATQVTATVPATLAPGAATVTVTPIGAAASNGLVYTVDAAPAPVPAAAITSLSPTHGLTATSVVITGSNLGSGGTVRFGATTAATTAWSATQVTPRRRHRDRDAARRASRLGATTAATTAGARRRSPRSGCRRVSPRRRSP